MNGDLWGLWVHWAYWSCEEFCYICDRSELPARCTNPFMLTCIIKLDTVATSQAQCTDNWPYTALTPCFIHLCISAFSPSTFPHGQPASGNSSRDWPVIWFNLTCVTSVHQLDIGRVDIDWISECLFHFLISPIFHMTDWPMADFPVGLVECGHISASVSSFHYGVVCICPLYLQSWLLPPFRNEFWGPW